MWRLCSYSGMKIEHFLPGIYVALWVPKDFNVFKRNTYPFGMHLNPPYIHTRGKIHNAYIALYFGFIMNN